MTFLRLPLRPLLLLAMVATVSSSSGCRPNSSRVQPAGPGSWGRPGSPTVGERLGIASNPPLGTDARSRARRARDLDAIRTAGFRIVRLDFRWHQIEPRRGQFDFTRYDAVVADAHKRGLEILALLCYGNNWATRHAQPGENNRPPDNPADFARFVTAVVSHYRGRIDRFEIWNEPNVGFRFWKPTLGGDPQAYAALLRAAGRAAHRANPKAQVAFGGTFYPSLSPVVPGTLHFTREVYDFDPTLGTTYDTFAYHPYRYPFLAPEANGLPALPSQEPLEKTIEKVRKTLRQHGDGGKPLWITEIGWHTARWSAPFVGVDEKVQARYLVRATLLALSRDVELFIWYTLHDGAQSECWQEDAFGLLAHDPDPYDTILPRAKPAYRAHQTLSKMLGTTRFVQDEGRALRLPSGVHGLRFEAPSGRRVTTLWIHDKKRRRSRIRVPVPAGHRRARIVGLTGTSRPLVLQRSTRGPEPFEVEITLGNDPVYVESR